MGADVCSEPVATFAYAVSQRVQTNSFPRVITPLHNVRVVYATHNKRLLLKRRYGFITASRRFSELTSFPTNYEMLEMRRRDFVCRKKSRPIEERRAKLLRPWGDTDSFYYTTVKTEENVGGVIKGRDEGEETASHER